MGLSPSSQQQKADDPDRIVSMLEAVVVMGKCEELISSSEELFLRCEQELRGANFKARWFLVLQVRALQKDIRTLKAYRSKTIKQAGLKVKGNIFHQG